MSFSERHGYKSIDNTIQVDRISEGLRNRLWNVINKYIMGPAIPEGLKEVLYSYIWDKHFKFTQYHRTFFELYVWECLFSRDANLSNNNRIKLNHSWYFIYDFIEHVLEGIHATQHDIPHLALTNMKSYMKILNNYIAECNQVLTDEHSAWRIIDKKICKITDEIEIKAVNDVFAHLHSKIEPVKIQIENAITLFGDKVNPDYRNVIKESINAVESLCKIVTNKPSSTLSPSLEDLIIALKNKGIEFHEDFKDAIKKIYHYTSDAGGIRHGLMDKAVVSEEDARFMLVLCSAFINYIIIKAEQVQLLN